MIQLGEKVKDTVSGFEGIAVASHHYLQGCNRITVQPPVDKDGKLPDPQSFDEPQLVKVGDGLLPAITVPPIRKPGGPSKFEDSRRY